MESLQSNALAKLSSPSLKKALTNSVLMTSKPVTFDNSNNKTILENYFPLHIPL